MRRETESTFPLRVLQVFHSLGMGGAETWLIELLRFWAKSKQVQCDVLLTGALSGVFSEEASSLGARLYHTPFGQRHFISFSRKFRQILKSQGYSAIHDHQDRISGWHFALGWPHLPRVRISHIHNPSYQIRNNYEVSLGRRLTAVIGKRLMRRLTTHITATSYQMIEEYGFASPEFTHIPKAALHCAFDVSRFKNSRTDARLVLSQELKLPNCGRWVLFAGRMDRSPSTEHVLNHKNSALAVEFMIRAIQQMPEIRLLMAGAISAALPTLQQRIAQEGLTGHFHFLGIRHDIESLMAACDLLLFPSRGEGLGMVAVEAQAAGLPVLASSAVPKECVVIPGLVTFKDLSDPVISWADLICRLVSQDRVDADLANEQVARSAFAIPVCAKRLEALYRLGTL